MHGTSPSTTTSNNRGGRPKDWTDERARKLVRLYVYTTLTVPKILDVLKDHTWKPGKDAANKWLNQLLGHDPRWIKPRSPDEQEKRMAGLKASYPRRKCRKVDPATGEDAGQSYSTTNRPCSANFQDLDNLDGLTLDPSRDPSMAESSGSTLANLSPWFSAEADLHLPYESLYDPLAESPRYERNSFLPMPQLFQRPLGGRGTRRQDSSLTSSTDPSIASSFRARLSDATPGQVKAAFQLIKRYTIPKEAEDRASPSSPLFPTGLYAPARTDSKRLQFIVPGDFLRIDTMQQAYELTNFNNPAGEADEVWSKMATEVSSAESLWPSKGYCSINLESPWDLQSLDPTTTDDFGNTIFHFLAAKGSQRALVDQIMQTQGPLQSAVGSKNTAGQTLLHVLNPSWFEDGSSLDELLNILQHLQLDILAVDVYGRNFFHLLQENRLNHERIRDLARSFDIKVLNRRDAFDRKPMNSRSARLIRQAAAIYRLYPGRTPRLNISTEDPTSTRIRPHIELIKLIRDAMAGGTQSSQEDLDGRNAFHSLAEVVLGNEPIQKHAQPPSMKRKLGDDMEPKLQEGPLSWRLELLGNLIRAGVDVNHYDKTGQTPLMAFVKHIPDGTKEDRDLRQIIMQLVKAGANMEARNRQGETALYMAARLGKKVALKQLIELGANVYVRNAHGLHVLEATHQALSPAASDTQQYARLHSCSAFLTGQLGEGWKTATVLDEWGIRRH